MASEGRLQGAGVAFKKVAKDLNTSATGRRSVPPLHNKTRDVAHVQVKDTLQLRASRTARLSMTLSKHPGLHTVPIALAFCLSCIESTDWDAMRQGSMIDDSQGNASEQNDITDHVDPSGEPIEGDSLITILCFDEARNQHHGLRFVIGGRNYGTQYVNYPEAPECDRDIYGRHLDLWVRDSEFVRNPVGTWLYEHFDGDRRVYRDASAYVQAELHALDYIVTDPTDFIILPVVHLSLEISEWDGDRYLADGWTLQNPERRELIGNTISGRFRVELIDGSVQEGMIQGIWCGGTPSCEGD